MTITERNRRHLYEGLEESLGADRAELLMQLLPTHPADELVTISYFQTEMGALRSDLRGEMAELRGEMRGEIGEVRGEMGQLRADVTDQLADMKSGMNRWAAALLTSNTVAIVTVLTST